MRPKPRAVAAAALLALAAAGTAAAGNGGFAPVEPRSENAEGIRDAYFLILGLAAGVFVLVEGALIVFLVRFRGRGRGRAVEGPQIRGNTNLEIAWTVTPVLILAAIAAFVFVKLPDIENVPPARAGERLAIRVVGQQFAWQFEYPGGEVSVDELVVPAGEVVTLDVVSPDVVHSWWVPELGGKIDAIPGRTTHTWFRADRPGTYTARCAELCGIEHAHMKARVRVVTDAEFATWLAGHAPGSETVGRETVEGLCAKCHGLAGEGDIGPAIQGSAFLSDEQGLTALLREGRGRMPAVGSHWEDEQLDATIAYLRQRFGQAGGE